jgi:CHAT domain-containing protein/tetratricopeptide (TPR) repeat protein
MYNRVTFRFAQGFGMYFKSKYKTFSTYYRQYLLSGFGMYLLISLLIFHSSRGQGTDFIKSHLNSKADSLIMLERYEEAASLYNRAILLAEENQDPLNEIHALNKLGFIRITEEKYTHAHRLLTKVDPIRIRLVSEKHIPVAENYMYKGLVYARTNKFDSAIYYHDKAIEIKTEVSGERSLELAESLYFKGQLLHHRMSNYSRAEELYRAAIDIYRIHLSEDHFILGKLYSEMAACLKDQFDFTNAIQYGRQAIEISKNDPESNPRQLVSSYIIFANSFTVIERWEEALFYYNEAYQLLNKYLESDDLYAAFLFINWASAFIFNKNYEAGKELLDRGNEILTRSRSPNSRLLAFLYLLYGVYYTGTDQDDPAKENLRSAIEKFETLNIQQSLVYSYEYTGDFYQHVEQPDSALHYYQLALISQVDDFNEMDYTKNPTRFNIQDVSRMYDILYKKAAAFRKYHTLYPDRIQYLEASLNIYLLINRLNDESRNSRTTDASLLLINEYYRSEYEKGIDCAYELYQMTSDPVYLGKAFILMEKSKYMLLFEALSRAEKRKAIDLPEEIKLKEDSLRAQYENLQRELEVAQLDDSVNEEYLNEVQNRLFYNTRAQDNLKIRMAREYPAYYQIKYDSLFKSLEDFRQYCGEENMVGIEYFWGEKAVYVIGVDQKKHAFSKIDRSRKLNDMLSNFLHQLDNGPDMSSIKEDYRAFISVSNRIYTELVGKPLATFDIGNSQPSLMIVPDGVLAQVSFEALLTAPGDSTYADYAALPYLIHTAEIGYAYSANLLLNSRSSEKKPKNDLLAFSFSGGQALTEMNSRSDGQIELPHTEVELHAIRESIHGNNYYFDEEATESRFKESAPDFRILHLAVHGVADSTSAANSRLIFKKIESVSSPADGIVYTYELYNLDLSGAQLAVLSACETGIGKEFTGEGVFSMARGFAYAGCPSIIMSLWRVSDKYTAPLMEAFYKGIKKGHKGKEALRTSKLQYIAESGEYNSHPSYWASFVFLGKDGQYFSSNRLILIFGSVFLLITIIIVLVRRFPVFS